MDSSRQAALDGIIAGLGHDFSGEIRAGGDYLPVVIDGPTAYVSGQVPRVGTVVVVTGAAGSAVTLQDAQRAAVICTVRALLLLRQSLGSLERIRRVLRVGVFVQSAPQFGQQSEVADAASGLLRQVLGDAGAHTRTSVGVLQLPKNATVEIEMTVSLEAGDER
ncbi:MAG: RidA family protein [Ramlibacter sp.]|nr:RidA family protein [Ramlibacter sp.]